MENDNPENLGTKSDIFLSGLVSDFGKAKFSEVLDAEYGKYLDVIHGDYCDKKVNATIFLRHVLGTEWRRWLRSNLYVSKLGGSQTAAADCKPTRSGAEF